MSPSEIEFRSTPLGIMKKPICTAPAGISYVSYWIIDSSPTPRESFTLAKFICPKIVLSLTSASLTLVAS